MNRIKELIIPRNGKDESLIIEENEQLIIIGGNGTGKSRLGFSIEQKNQNIQNKIIRISAQRSLSLPKEVYADNNMHGSFKEKTPQDIKRQKKFEDFIDFEQDVMFDYDDLLSFLFSNHQFHINTSYKQKKKGKKFQETDTLLENVINIWNKLIEKKVMESNYNSLNIYMNLIEHNASFLSDGERVLFYLIGQVLASPRNSILIIDEPELHIHKGLHKKIWDILEIERPDNLFIFITHDLDFAASRVASKRVWIKDYKGEEFWDWEFIESIENLPDSLLFELLGSRKDILFVEGDCNSYDTKLYTLLFPNYSVISVGSCHNVIRCTEAFNAQKKLHHLNVAGLIDRDGKFDQEIISLKKNNISVLKVAEVENIFLIPEILKIVANNQGLPDLIVEEIQDLIIKRLKERKNEQISLHTMSEIKFYLSNIDSSVKGLNLIQDYVNNMINGLSVYKIYEKYQNNVENIIKEKKYEDVLRLFNDKGLVKYIDPIFNFQSEKGNSEFINLALRLLAKNSNLALEVKNVLIKRYINLGEQGLV